jgi:hypothetical protein
VREDQVRGRRADVDADTAQGEFLQAFNVFTQLSRVEPVRVAVEFVVFGA